MAFPVRIMKFRAGLCVQMEPDARWQIPSISEILCAKKKPRLKARALGIAMSVWVACAEKRLVDEFCGHLHRKSPLAYCKSDTPLRVECSYSKRLSSTHRSSSVAFSPTTSGIQRGAGPHAHNDPMLDQLPPQRNHTVFHPLSVHFHPGNPLLAVLGILDLYLIH